MTTQPKLIADHFPGFFEALHKHPPFCWQAQLAEQVCNGHWPDFIKLPTSSGKTACIDIAVFALAVQAARHHETGQSITAPRRVFFVVDRRVIVNEAFQRAADIGTKLDAAVDDEISPLHPVAFWLRSLANHGQALGSCNSGIAVLYSSHGKCCASSGERVGVSRGRFARGVV